MNHQSLIHSDTAIHTASNNGDNTSIANRQRPHRDDNGVDSTALPTNSATQHDDAGASTRGAESNSAAAETNGGGEAEDAARTPRSKRRSRPPQKFVARPSKQGLSVEEGDAAFLEAVYSAEKRKAASKKRRRVEKMDGGGYDERSRIDSDHDNDNDVNDCNGDNHAAIGDQKTVEAGEETRSMTSNESDEEMTRHSKATTAGENSRPKKASRIAGGNASRSQSKSTLSSRKTTTAGNTTTSGKRNNGTVALSPLTVPRKSAISRRPRPVRPTEKILAMHNNAAVPYRSKSKTDAMSKKGPCAKSTQRESDLAPEQIGDEGLWPCRSCGWDNLQTKKRCSKCQGWRGGVRRDLTKSSKESNAATESAEEKDVLSSSPLPSSWQCTNCGNCVSPNRARCGQCQGWRGGVRDNIAKQSKKTTKRTKNVSGSSAKTNRDKSIRDKNRNLINGDETKSVDIATAATEEHFENQDEHSNLDDVACCLCKCAVDFGDKFFFLPETTNATSKVEEDGNDVQPHAAKVASAAASSAIVSSECSVADVGAIGSDASPASPMTVIRASTADVLPERILVDHVSSSVDGVENAGNDPSVKVASPSKVPEDDMKEATTATTLKREEPLLDDGSGDGSQDPHPPFRLPHRFYDPRNSLILCDGPEHASRRKSSSGSQYKCDRAYHQLCHFIPVFNVPRGAWRCLICRYRDDEFLKRKASKAAKRKSHETDDNHLSDEQLSAIFRMVPEPTPSSDSSSAEQLFEVLSAPLKARLLHVELTARAKSLINSSLSNIRTAEHSIRAFTETTKARKALMERIESMGLPQELIQCFARVAQAKMKIRDLIQGVENAIHTRQHHDPFVNSNGGKQSDCNDVVGELMNWYSSQKASDPDGTLFRNLFPEGQRTLGRRRVEPRTDEANAEADVASNSSGVSLDNLRCACCLMGHASDENDLLLCDRVGCYRAYHMCCLEPKLTPEDLAKDENEHWFCPLCKAHNELMQYAQREYLGDDFFSNSPHQEWEKASDIFPEAHFETSVAQKLKEGIRDDEVNEFLTEALGISLSLSAQQTDPAASLDYPEEEEDESDEDFDFAGEEEEDVDSSNNEDSDDEEKQLLEEKIDKDELDALSVCSSAVETDDDVMSGSSAGIATDRRSRRRKYLVDQRHGKSNRDDEQSRGISPSSDVGKLDTANIVYGKRNRTRVDYRKLNDAMFGDDSDDEANGADVKFAYKPKANIRHDSSSSDESEDDDDSSDDHQQLAAFSSKAKPAKTKLKKITGVNKKRTHRPALGTTSSGDANDSWSCTKCGNNNSPTKKRCSNCQGWRGGVRDNIRSPARKQART